MATVTRRKNLTLESARASLEARARARKEGLELPDKPKGDLPDLPRDLAELSDEDLMETFSEFTAWTNYVGGKFAIAEVDEEAAEAWLKKVEAMALVTANPGKGEIMRAKAEQAVDPEVEDAREVRLNAYAYRKVLGALYENVQRSQAALSRELTRRVGRDGPERRNSRWTP